MDLIQKNVSLADKNHYRIGGDAAFYTCIERDSDVVYTSRWAKENDQPVFILGKGSNILVSDEGWNGLVIDLSEYRRIRWKKNRAVCCGGTQMDTLIMEMMEMGLRGMEDLSGIPGTIGGALVMNAGAFDQTISDCLRWVSGLNVKTGEKWLKKRDEIVFGYRKSSIRNGSCVVLEAEFEFSDSSGKLIKERITHILEKRARKQPIDYPSCGSVFKRPEGNYAGALIEACQLKGYRVGGASISRKHANFIINESNATAKDVRELIAYTQKRVYEARGVLLEPEVVFVGTFDCPLFQPRLGADC